MGTLLVVTAYEEYIGDFDDQIDEGHNFLRSGGSEIYGDPKPKHGGYHPYDVYSGFYSGYRPYGGFYGGYLPYGGFYGRYGRPESAESLVNAKLGLRIHVRGKIELPTSNVFGRPFTTGTSILMRRRPCVLGPMVNRDGRRYKPLCLIGKYGLVCYGKPRC